MSVNCEYGCCPEESESHDCGDALEVGAVDGACILGWSQAVHVPYGDCWGLVEERLPYVVWYLGWGRVVDHLSCRLTKSVRPYVAGENVGG